MLLSLVVGIAEAGIKLAYDCVGEVGWTTGKFGSMPAALGDGHLAAFCLQPFIGPISHPSCVPPPLPTPGPALC
jgi:hypothetical protein